MDRVGLADDRADRLARVQRRVGVLEDHLHLAAHRLQRRALDVRDVLPVKAHFAGGRLQQSRDQARGGALATARLADDAQRLAALHVEADAVDRLHGADLFLHHDPARQREVLDQVAHLHERVAAAACSCRLLWHADVGQRLGGPASGRSSAHRRLRTSGSSRQATW